MPEIGETGRFKNRAAWRSWLKKHHMNKEVLWLLFVKKHVKEARISYEAAVEEALCFGWIDGLKKRVDDDEYAIRFTPRKANSVWSELNKKRVRRLQRAGQMTAAGMALVAAGKKSGQWQRAKERGKKPSLPDDLAQALARDEIAQQGFFDLAPSHRVNYIRWIEDAKRPATRQRRLQKTVERVAQGKKPGDL